MSLKTVSEWPCPVSEHGIILLVTSGRFSQRAYDSLKHQIAEQDEFPSGIDLCLLMAPENPRQVQLEFEEKDGSFSELLNLCRDAEQHGMSTSF